MYELESKIVYRIGQTCVLFVGVYIDNDNNMQWEFRKAVESFDSYKRTTGFRL